MKDSHFSFERKRLVSIMLLSLLGVAFMPVLPTFAIASVRVNPPTNSYDTATTPVGFKFNITVWVDNVADLFAWQVEFAYNSSQLLATRAWQPTWDSQYVFFGKPVVIPVGPTFYSSSVVIGESLLPPSTAFSGPTGKLAIVELQVKSTPPKFGALNSGLTIDVGTFGTKLKNSSAGTIVFIAVNGTFTYTWSAPTTKPNLVVDPASVVFGPSPPNATGQWFNISVWVKNLDAAWGLTNANFTLSFNATLIEVISVTVNSLWTTKNVDNITTLGKILVLVGSPSSTPSGNVMILTVEFRILYQGHYPNVDTSDLLLENIRLVDHVAEIPTEPPVSGKVVIKGLLPTTLEVKPRGHITDKLETFAIDIWLNNIIKEKRLVGLQFRLLYNSTLLQFVNVTEGPFLQQFGQTPRLRPEPTMFLYFNESDYVENNIHYGPNVLVGIVIWTNSTGAYNVFPEGRGVLATITFKGIYRGSYPTVATSAIQLIAIKLVDDQAKNIGTGPAINGYYTILPTTPTLKVEPTTYEAKKIGEIFSIGINLSNIIASAEMAGIEFKLDYNATKIQLINVTEGSFLLGFGSTTFNYTLLDNSVRVKNYLNSPYTSFPNGNGIIAAIAFKAIYRGYYPEEINSTLGLREIMLLDSKQSKMPFVFENGFYKMLPYRLPVALFTISPSMGTVAQKIDCNASDSYDPDGNIVSYIWNFGDGNITTVTTSTLAHVYQAPGTYSVNLTVTDDDGLTNSTLASLEVRKQGSAITLNVNVQTVTVGSDVIISGNLDPVKNNVDVTMQYRVAGTATWTNLITVKTNSNGYYTHTWKVTDAGAYDLKASWPGDASTLPAESNVKTVKVEAPTDTFLFVILALIIILVLIVSVIIYRKKIRKHELQSMMKTNNP